MNAHELKSLKTRHSKLSAEMDGINAEESLLAEKKRTIKKALERAAKKIEANTKKIQMTEHALLRYYERRFSLDLEEQTAEIIKEIQKMGDLSENGKFPIGNGLRAVVKDSVIVTITGKQ